MRRVLLLIAGFLLLTGIAVPAAALYFLIYTQGGLVWLIGRVPHQIGSVGIQIARPSGTLAHGIRIGQVDIEHQLVHLTIRDIQGRVALTPLLLQTVRTKGASIASVDVQVKRRTRPSVPSTPVFLPHWLIVNADHFRIDHVDLKVYNGVHLEYSNLHATGVARYRKIRFYELGAVSGALAMEGSGTLEAYDPLRLDMAVKMHWTPGDQPAWMVDTLSKGDLKMLAVTAHTVAPFRSDFTGQALNLTGQWHWLGNAIVHDLDVTAWGGNKILGLLSGQLSGRGNANGFTAQGPMNSAGLNVGLFDTQFEGQYANHILWAKHIDITHQASHAHVTGAGLIEVVKDGPRLDLRGNWRDFRWPLIGKDIPFHSASGDFTLAGTWPYAVHASGLAQARDLPPMPTTLDGHLARDRFSFDRAGIELYGGHANMHGEAVWTPRDSWAAAGHISDVNPALVRPDLPGRLSFDLDTRGHGFDGIDYSIDVRELSGRLRSVAASGAGFASHGLQGWQFDKIHLGLGGTNLSVDGHLSDSFNLRFAVNARDLSLLAANSRGQLEGSGTIKGNLQKPVVAATLHGNGIEHEGLRIAELGANIDFNPDPLYESHVDVHVGALQFQERKLDELTFKLHGRSSDYAVRLDAKGLGLAFTAVAGGPFNQGVWQGQLTNLDLVGTESVRLKLQKPVDVSVSANAARLQKMCLTGQPGSLCAEGQWTPAAWDGTFTADRMPVAFFTAGMTPGVDYSGTINFLAKAGAQGEEPPQGSVRIDLTDAQLSHKLSSGRIDHSKIGSGFITLSANRTALTGEVGLESGDVGTIKGTLSALRGLAGWQAMPLVGEIHAHTDQLGLITLYVPDIDRASGHLDADMAVAGTLGTPLVDGDLKISDGEIDYYQVNLGLRQLAFAAKLTDNGVDFNGSTRIGSGIANAKGRLEWRNSLPYGKVHVEGSNLRVSNVPEAQIDASPNLEFDINGRHIEVGGAVKVPFAKIVPADMTGAVRASSDEVILGQEQTDPSKRFEVVSTITLSLLDHVSIDTTGLTGRLTGNITVRSGYDELTSATGELNIEQGKYSAYARKLDIQRGRLIFTGGPVGNPGIDIRAIKEFPDVTAGVNVRGTLLQPRMSFFSDPSLTQSQIVSLILSGGSLESAQTQQHGAGNQFVAQGGALLAQQLGSRVGIEDVSLEQDLTNETSLVLGRYLSPRLYVSYGIALTEQLNVLKLRYSLGDRWTIKTEVGQARGADLVYTIQR